MKKNLNIFIGGQDRAGTTLLATYLGSIDKNYKVLYETPFKFKYLKTNFLIRNFLSKEFDNPKYYNEFGFKKFPTKKEISEIFDSQKFVDHTPKNLWYYNSLKDFKENSIFVFVYREKTSLYLAHKRVNWGLKNPIKFIFWYYLTYYRMMILEKFNDVLVLQYDKLILDEEEYLNKKLFKKFSIKVNNRVKIPLASYTKEQHKLVNKKIRNNLITDKLELNLKEIIIFRSDFIIKPICYMINKILI